MRKALGRRAILLHLSGFPCQYQRRVVDTKIYHHKCFSYYTTILTKLFSPVKNLSKPLFREQFLIDREVEIFEHVEDDAFDACVPGEKIAHGLGGDLGGAVVWEAENAGGNAAESDAFEIIFGSEGEAAFVAAASSASCCGVSGPSTMGPTVWRI